MGLAKEDRKGEEGATKIPWRHPLQSGPGHRGGLNDRHPG